MNDNYVSLEIAKLLKEKGFPQDYEVGVICRIQNKWNSYYERKRRITEKDLENSLAIFNEVYPPLHTAQMWLREEKEIHIMVDVCASGYYAVLWKTNGTFIKTLADKGPNDGGVWATYENALEAGILESLKFI